MGSRRWSQVVPSASGIRRVTTRICGVDVQALCVQPPAHLLLEGAHLIEDVDHLAAGVRPAQHAVLAEPAVGREDADGEDHGNRATGSSPGRRATGPRARPAAGPWSRARSPRRRPSRARSPGRAGRGPGRTRASPPGSLASRRPAERRAARRASTSAMSGLSISCCSPRRCSLRNSSRPPSPCRACRRGCSRGCGS